MKNQEMVIIGPEDGFQVATAKSRKTKNTITIRDVAEESGFSATTVSIVLNNAPLARYIPPHTKTRIQKAAKKLGYHPNIFAKSLRSKRNHTVGVMVFDVTDPYCTLIIRGIENSLYQASYLPMMTDAHNDRSRFERYLEMLLERRVEALIVLANWLFIDINLLADLEKSEIPTVIIGRDLESKSISSVTVDEEGGASAALAHLHALGHRKIAFVRGPKALMSAKKRWKGIQKFAQDAGLDLDQKLIVDLPDQLNPNVGVEDGYRMTEELLKRKKGFTALMAFDDMTALGAIRALTKAGVKVPEQCSVIGFDDVIPSALFVPSLSTVRQPMEAMGATAVNIAMDGISARAENREFAAVQRKLPSELVLRESTRAIP
ncbi:MAG TPA: LacI family DNA-binding transcriptional regulator [Candidatus Angelobacter sp.]|nr:LacI family DNA-binding transcriptional regulator [Candidatus Angelobacter sp.]